MNAPQPTPTTAPAAAADANVPQGDYTRRALLVLAAALVLAGVLFPLDEFVARFAQRFQERGDLAIGGDLRRTLHFLQQFGDLASTLIAGLCVFLLDPARRARLLDWVVAAVATSLSVQALKMGLGRPRPRIAFDPMTPEPRPFVHFTWPWETFPLPRVVDNVPALVERHAWDLGGGISSDLWSMPSSHTSAAAVLAVVLTTLYPRLAPLAWPLLGVVALSRVLFGAHYLSDVVAGAGVGYAVATLAMRGQWGTRLAGALKRGGNAPG